jgi:hypothetical protein
MDKKTTKGNASSHKEHKGHKEWQSCPFSPFVCFVFFVANSFFFAVAFLRALSVFVVKLFHLG